MVSWQAHYSTGKVSASFTSTAMVPETTHEAGSGLCLHHQRYNSGQGWGALVHALLSAALSRLGFVGSWATQEWPGTAPFESGLVLGIGAAVQGAPW